MFLERYIPNPEYGICSISSFHSLNHRSSHCTDEDAEAQEGRDLPEVRWPLHGGEVSWFSCTTPSLSHCTEHRAMVSGRFPQTISFVPHRAAILAKGLLPAVAFETHQVPWGNLSRKEIVASPEIEGTQLCLFPHWQQESQSTKPETK